MLSICVDPTLQPVWYEAVDFLSGSSLYSSTSYVGARGLAGRSVLDLGLVGNYDLRFVEQVQKIIRRESNAKFLFQCIPDE